MQSFITVSLTRYHKGPAGGAGYHKVSVGMAVLEEGCGKTYKHQEERSK